MSLPSHVLPSSRPATQHDRAADEVPAAASTILGLGTCIPEGLITNADLEALVDTSDSWIMERTGIRTRHRAGVGETAISVWYLGKVTFARITVPFANKVDIASYKTMPRSNYVDDLVLAKLQKLRVLPSDLATDEEFFFQWKDIFPEKYRQFTPPLGHVREQETLIQGMLPKETLLDLVRTCTVFMDVGKVRAKIFARYQQYRAVCKIIARFRKGNTPEERSGVVWHTQGSGKSLTMVFLIRKIV